MTTEIVPAKPDKIIGWLETKRKDIGAALANAMPEDYFLRCAATAIRRNPVLSKCEHFSLWQAVFQSAQCHLPPGDGTERSCIVPYGREAQFQIMYRGLIDLAYRSGQVASIVANVVYPHEKFVWNGPSSPVTHDPGWNSDYNIDEALGVYAQAQPVMGGWIAVRLNRKEVLERRNRSAAYRNGKGPWCDKAMEPAMWRKSAVREIKKFLPSSVFPLAVHSALEAEDARNYGTAKEAEIVVHNPAPVPEPAELREQLAALTKEMPPDKAEKVLDDAGIIGSLTECEDVALLSRAIEIARGK